MVSRDLIVLLVGIVIGMYVIPRVLPRVPRLARLIP